MANKTNPNHNRKGLLTEWCRQAERTPGFSWRFTQSGHVIIKGPGGAVTLAKNAKKRPKDVARLRAIGLAV